MRSGQSPQIRWGIVGPGRIARKVVHDVEHVPGVSVTVVASRSRERVQLCADEFAIPKTVGSYAELIADPAVDVLDIGVDALFDPSDRTFDPLPAGGAMLDLGVYPISYAGWLHRTPGTGTEDEPVSVQGSS
ncbi:MAG: Gfo/Idh/MocA family oxidoreductase [Propionibacteriaceae bacterium]